MVLNTRWTRNVFIPLHRADNAVHRARVLFAHGVISEAMFRAVHRIWMDAHVTEFFTACDESFLEAIEYGTPRYSYGAAA